MQAFFNCSKRIQLGRLLTVLFASICLLGSTIFLSGTAEANIQTRMNVSQTEGYYQSKGAQHRYDPNDGRGFYQAKEIGQGRQMASHRTIGNDKPEGGYYASQGGMNKYSDVDPRMNTRAADKKAAAMVDRAQKNLEKRVDSVDQYVENYRSGAPIQERTRRLGENISEGLERSQENAKNVGKSLARDYREATEGLKEGIPQVTQQAADNARNTARNLADDTKQSLRNTSDS